MLFKCQSVAVDVAKHCVFLPHNFSKGFVGTYVPMRLSGTMPSKMLKQSNCPVVDEGLWVA